MGVLDLHADIKVRIDGALVNTTVGRIVFNELLPPKLRFMDRVIDDKELGKVVRECYRHYGSARTVQLVDDLKELGFRYATIAGITISMADMDVPKARRAEIIARTETEVQKIKRQLRQGSDQPRRALRQRLPPLEPGRGRGIAGDSH